MKEKIFLVAVILTLLMLIINSRLGAACLFNYLNTGDNIASQLKRGLADLLAHGEANADAACRVLKVSRRTLQRRLKAEKTSFQKVLNEVRAELAVRYLSDRRLKSLEVAMLLGYSSISSFTTAFKSWYDMPPIEYRQKMMRFG